MGFRHLLLVLCVGVVGACGSDAGPVQPGDDDGWADPGVLRGSWRALKIEHRGQADTTLVTDLVPRGGSATLDVTAAGAYAFVLNFLVIRTERGLVRVRGGVVTFRPSSGTENTNSLQMRGDTVVLVGNSNFDVNSDTLDEPTVLTLELVAR